MGVLIRESELQIEWQAQQASQLCKPEVLRGLRNFLNVYKPEHHNIDCEKEGVMEKGGFTLQDWERFVSHWTKLVLC